MREASMLFSSYARCCLLLLLLPCALYIDVQQLLLGGRKLRKLGCQLGLLHCQPQLYETEHHLRNKPQLKMLLCSHTV